MVKLVVMSDSHGDDEAVEAILRVESHADAYIHCGDLGTPEEKFPLLITVKGNNDWYSSAPYERVLHEGGTAIYITHSHRISYLDRARRIAAAARDHGCSLALYGHTHVYDDQTIGGVRVVNPGSCWQNRDLSEPSYAVVWIDGGRVVKVERKECPSL